MKKLVIFIVALLFAANVYSSPFVVENDGDHNLFVYYTHKETPEDKLMDDALSIIPIFVGIISLLIVRYNFNKNRKHI